MNPATIDRLLADTTSPFKFDRAAFIAQASAPLPGSSWHRRHKRVVRRAKDLTLALHDHSFDPCHSARTAIIAVLTGDSADTVNTLADRTIPSDPLLALHKALMQMVVSIDHAEERVVGGDPGVPARRYMSAYVPLADQPDREAMYQRVSYRIRVELFLEGFSALPPLAASLASTDIRQSLVNCCRGMVVSHVKDILPLMQRAEPGEDLEIILNRAEPERFSYRYIARGD